MVEFAGAVVVGEAYPDKAIAARVEARLVERPRGIKMTAAGGDAAASEGRRDRWRSCAWDLEGDERDPSIWIARRGADDPGPFAGSQRAQQDLGQCRFVLGDRLKKPSVGGEIGVTADREGVVIERIKVIEDARHTGTEFRADAAGLVAVDSMLALAVKEP